MTDLIIPSLLPETERREYERMQRLKRPWTPLPQPPVKPKAKSGPKAVAKLPIKETVLKIEPKAEFIWSSDYQDAFQLLRGDESDGIPVQMPGSLGRDRELVIGLDFGTSCVKVVVGDRGASKAYAVPFLDTQGVNAYLLPSRVFEQNGIFSLLKGADVHRDLKLRFLAKPTSSELQETLVGFLALVIRRCRGWLFMAHAETFAHRNILWKLVLGRAVDRVKNDHVRQLMLNILNAAWVVAGCSGSVNRSSCKQELTKQKSAPTFGFDSPEISVVPELAAQIYGFVNSRQFDPRAKNIYLFIDVGAGTVDVSLFHVKRNEYGKWDFSLFTSIVEPNGTINLHRRRLGWWRQQLSKMPEEPCARLLGAIDDIVMPTEQTQPIPATYLGYFLGVDVQYSGGALSPDDEFYASQFVAQVRGRGIHRTVQTVHVKREDLDHLPFFLSGGGARLPLYKKIASALDQAPEFKWLKAHRRELGIPSELEAPGLAQVDYDRLSVAFGLSFVDVGTVAVAQAMPKLVQTTKVDWSSSYTSKDDC